MLEIILVILGVAILFSLTIFVHELGHFLVARWCGLKIEAFSIGFGPALWKKTVDGIDYKIGALPFGGYVALPQMDPTLGAQDKEKADSLERVSPGRKILVSLAGVTMNMIFAFLLALLVYWVGMPATPAEISSEVGYVDPDSAAYEAGFRVGDEILSVNDESVEDWQEFMTLASLRTQAVIRVEQRDGAEATRTLPTSEVDVGGLRMVKGLSGRSLCKVLSPVPGSSADEAGLQPGDLLTHWNGERIYSRAHMIALVQDTGSRTSTVTVVRNGDERTRQVKPQYNEEAGRYLIGIQFNTMYRDQGNVIHPGPIEQISNHSSLIFRVLRALVTPSESKQAAGSLGGPVAILFMIFLMLKNSFMVTIWFMGLINVNLAILNLLPIPILDGGHIVFALYEAVFRRPPPPRAVHILSNLFAVLLLGVFLLLTYRDTVRFILPSIIPGGDDAPVEQTNAPPQSGSPAGEGP